MKVKEAKVSSGFDDPEGGFDALLQVIVCKDRIGWRERARNIIVFATDSSSHLVRSRSNPSHPLSEF